MVQAVPSFPLAASSALIPMLDFSTNPIILLTSALHAFNTSSAVRGFLHARISNQPNTGKWLGLVTYWKLTIPFGLSIRAQTDPSTTSLHRVSSVCARGKSSRDVSLLSVILV